jgi:nascent polypeptide-associated complex subunit alpha
MVPGIDPKQMKRMMQQMGIKNTEIPAARVVIETDEGSNIVISSPSVVEIEMQGQKSYQISGTVSREESIKEDDVKLIMEQAGCEREKAVAALKDAKGDIAEAILKLKGE